MKIIIDPLNNKRYSISSKRGKKILKQYINIYNGNQQYTKKRFRITVK